MKNELRIITIIAVFGVVLGCAAASVAQDENAIKNPIDTEQAKCLKTHHGTMPRAKCYSAGSDAWQKKVEDTYTALLRQLPPKLQETLKKGQTAWEEYQAEEEDLISKLYPQRGTGFIAVRIIEIMKAYKDRALELESHLQTVKGSETVN